MTIATRIVKGACPHDCPEPCALEYRVADGKLLKVKGSASHSVTAGVLCMKVAMAFDGVDTAFDVDPEIENLMRREQSVAASVVTFTDR